MISHQVGDCHSIAPLWRLGGLVRDWSPRPPVASHEPAGCLAHAGPAAVQPEPWTPGALGRGDPEVLHIPAAESHPIDWFELRPGGEQGDDAGSESPRHATAPERQAGAGSELLRRLSAVLQPPVEYLLAPGSVLYWPAPLLPYQRTGVRALLSQRALLLADDMGLGKTVQAIAALRILAWRRELGSALVVCPASLVRQWGREFARWAPELRVIPVAGPASDRGTRWRLPAHVRLVSYETLRADVLDLRDSPATRREWGVVVLDEAARIKNRETDLARACRLLPRNRRWALTGTPLENRIEDVTSILEFLDGAPGRHLMLPATLVAVRAALGRVQVRRRKSEVLTELPPKQIHEILLELPPEQRAAYDQAEQEGVVQLRRAGPAITILHVLELITRLKQICNVDPLSGDSAKLADIRDRLQVLVEEGHRALVFSQFTDDRFGVARAGIYLREFQPLEFTGKLSAGQKHEIVERFQAEPEHKVLILSLRAGGLGLNLQSASYVFHLDRWWNPAVEDQAESRSHRMGQEHPVTAIRYLCARTIEERIHQKLMEKRHLFRMVVDDVSLDLRQALTEAELFGLFGLEAPPRADIGR